MRSHCVFSVSVCAVLVALGTPGWAQQTYNPTASDLVTGNTSGGTGSLLPNKGINNTAFGRFTLPLNTGNANTAFGTGALQANREGSGNVAVGMGAGRFTATGKGNSFIGREAARLNKTGDYNVALGHGAQFNNTEGSVNTFVGFAAGTYATGSYNTGLGWGAGINNTAGDHNLYLGSFGIPFQEGTTESNTTRIGNELQTRTFITGVANVPIAGVPVVIDPVTGQLGVAVQSQALTTTPTEDFVIKMTAEIERLSAEVKSLQLRLEEKVNQQTLELEGDQQAD